ncbi:Trs120-domain-containing protein [Xylariomycetidae sp. FL0641]|nr:Trs120-domain-containing protein [Xylariomycetidae sp. FL0641]
MSLDYMLPVAPARVRALVLPIGQIRRERFAAFVERLNEEHVVHLRDISADGRPNRNMFSPLAFPDGAIFYDLITYVPPPSHLSLAPFDLFREPLAVIAIADGAELGNVPFSKRQSASSHAPTMMERNIRTLYQELEELRDTHPKMLTHHVLIFDYTPPEEHEIHIPDGIKTVPPVEHSKRTTMKTIMCDVSSLLLAEMETLARSFEGMTVIDSPGQTPTRPGLNGTNAWTSDDANPAARRNSQHAPVTRSASTSGAADRSLARMSMPVPFKSRPFSSSPSARPTTPVKSGLSHPPTTFDDIASANASPTSPEHKIPPRPGTSEGAKSSHQDKVSVQGFGPGGLNDRWRSKGKGRVTILIGSLYLQAGRWIDSLKELVEGATVAKSINDHLWHGKALELIVMTLMLLAWADFEFQVPAICLSPNEKTPSSVSKGEDADDIDPDQPRHLRNLQVVLPDVLDRIIGLSSRISGEQLPPLPFSEMIIRFCNMLTALHLCGGKLNQESLEVIVFGKFPPKVLTTSPRLTITPTRGHIVNLLFKAFPSSTPEVLTTVDRAIILSGIAANLGTLGYHRKKAMVVRELVSVLISGLVEARTRGAAEVGIHPAAGLVALNAVNGHGNGAGALELGEGDIEHGVDAFLGLLCRTYGVVSFEDPAKAPAAKPSAADDTDARVISRIQNQASTRIFGVQNVKLNILRACINFSEALPDFSGVLRFSSDLLRTAGSGVAPGPRREDAAPIITRDEQVRLYTNISKTADLSQRLGLGHLSAEYWDEFLIRGITLDPLLATKTPIPHSKNVLPGVTTARTSQDVNPFIYNPFLRAAGKAATERTLVTGEPATFRITIQNPYEIDVEIESIRLDTEGAEFECPGLSTIVGPYRTQIMKIKGTPKAAGSLKVTGAVVRVRGCRERRFPIFEQSWAPDTEIKVKGMGLGALEQNKMLPPPGPALKPDSISLSVIPAQPVVVVKSTTIPQSCVMVLEGERQVFSVTLQNLSPDTPADLLLFSFQDSTQAPLHTAIMNRDATPAELYEYELILARKQALRLCKVDETQRYIAPNGTATFDFELLGKPGLTNATVQIDYAYLGIPQSEVVDQFHTRQACLDLTVTVNASVELSRLDVLPVREAVPRPIWDSAASKDAVAGSALSDDHCLLLMDLRNAWPGDMLVRLTGENGLSVEELVLPGNTNRVIFPIPRVYLENPHASIPALNPSRQRQFVVSSSKITPEIERGNREAFWYREKMLESLTATWRTESGGAREGSVELRGIRLAPRMIEAIKIDEVGIDLWVEPQPSSGEDAEVEDSKAGEKKKNNDATVFVDTPFRLYVRVTNRSQQRLPRPTVRIMPALRHRGGGLSALDLTRKLAWNGVLQRGLPGAFLEAGTHADVVLGATPLCRGAFEVAASVEETVLPPLEGSAEKGGAAGGGKRARSDTEIMMDAVLGKRERRVWHSRMPCLLTIAGEEA